MAFYLSPLVDVNEIDLSTTIPAVATSIGVILLSNTYKGPELQKQLVTSEDELVEIFGKTTNNVNCYRDMLAASGFLKYGNKLYATRCLADDAAFAGLKCADSGTAGAGGRSPGASYFPRVRLPQRADLPSMVSSSPRRLAPDTIC